MKEIEPRPTIAGLFAGIGGIELGLERAGFVANMQCERLPEARAVLSQRFGEARLYEDVRALVQRPAFRLPMVDVVSAGFPCQDLSQCGGTAGIRGKQSGLVDCLFELLSRRVRGPRWVLLENVPFMLRLDRGRAMSHLTRSLEQLGFAWAYRTVDARAFGLPQRRQRVVIVASRTEDPRLVLFADHAEARLPDEQIDDRPCGFYWTEGNSGLGWAIDSVPTLKAGSTIGIPSPPAIWLPAFDRIVTPTIEDAESMQGLPRGWTAAATNVVGISDRSRWRLVGNAVPVPIAEWVGRRLVEPGARFDSSTSKLSSSDPWPLAAYGALGQRFAVDVTTWPVARPWRGLESRYGLRGERLMSRPPLSRRAAGGFLARIQRSSLRTDGRFIPSLRRYVAQCSKA
jgi:DNA (cytosine-5)-methyltransferase 1